MTSRRRKRERLDRAASVTMAAQPLAADGTVAVEPVPLRSDFEEAISCSCDLGVMVAEEALRKLGWTTAQGPAPLLVVHPSSYAYALHVSTRFGGLLRVWASGLLTQYDIDTWFIAWRGRRVGSIGA